MMKPARCLQLFLLPAMLLPTVLLALLPAVAWSKQAGSQAASSQAASSQAAGEGRDYALIESGVPWQPLAGKIEVVEVFAYWCGHCARFQPMIDAWKRKLPDDVRFTPLPLPSGREDAFARGHFAVRAAGGLEQVHAPLFVAVHEQGTVPARPSIDELAAWYGQHGLDGARLKIAMAQPALGDTLMAARQFAIRSGVEGTPTLIVNGRYRILGDDLGALLEHADALIAQLRAASR